MSNTPAENAEHALTMGRRGPYSDGIKTPNVGLVLRLSLLTLLIGRAWQHLVWDPPYRELLWSELLLKSTVESLTSFSWHEWVTSRSVNVGIQRFVKAVGIFFVIGAVGSLVARKDRRAWMGVFAITTLLMIFLSFMYWKEGFYRIGMLMEYAIQALTPLFLLIWIYVPAWRERRLPALLAVAITLTFAGHGLFALGYYPVPGPFIDMIIQSLGISEQTARSLLFAAGIADFVVAFGIYVPKLRVPILAYAVAWGALTALARVVFSFRADMWADRLAQSVPELVYRLPHALVPLALLLIWRRLRTA